MNIRHWIVGVVAFFVVYWGAVIASGSGLNLFGIKWHFENSGQFGDSFGPLASVMSAIAAIAALGAYRSQKEELDRLKNSAKAERERVERNDFEGTFFQLVNLFRDTLSGIDVDQQVGGPARGPDAFQRLISDYMVKMDENNMLTQSSSNFKKMYNSNQNDLGHYFRLFYHIVRFIDESEVDEKIKYVRIFRSLLSNAEMVMIGLNCSYGAGHKKLRPLVEKYALLHNISASRAKQFGIVGSIGSAAFGDRTISADNMLSD
jgi:hypothetical protein